VKPVFQLVRVKPGTARKGKKSEAISHENWESIPLCRGVVPAQDGRSIQFMNRTLVVISSGRLFVVTGQNG
jgi:hypothetical protein